MAGGIVYHVWCWWLLRGLMLRELSAQTGGGAQRGDEVAILAGRGNPVA